MESISDRIKEVRLTVTGKKLSQDEFAKALGMSRSALANLADAENRLPNGVPMSAIKLICATYHVNYLWLTEGKGIMMEMMDTDALVDKYMANESEWAKSIMKSFARLPDEEWYKLRNLIEQIKRESHP